MILLSGIVPFDLALPAAFTAMPLLVAVPTLAVLTCTRTRCSSFIGLAALLVAAPLAAEHGGATPVVVTCSLAGIVVTSVMMWVACRRQERSDGTQAGLRTVLEAMQRAVLRPVPPRLGPLAAHARYLAAAAHAQVGGDLYDGVITPCGVRLIVGDAMGEGLSAVEKATDVLGAFRELAQNEATLGGMAVRLDTIPPAPPLGPLGMRDDGWTSSMRLRLGEGDRLPLYTDGVTEARDADGRFFPLDEHVADHDDEGPADLVAIIEGKLRKCRWQPPGRRRPAAGAVGARSRARPAIHRTQPRRALTRSAAGDRAVVRLLCFRTCGGPGIGK
ncbi:SpoIIE family protein phosphatase [Spirillospora sp. NPDC047279]|uniref:SpoIIE family protein phosphatase n=1 Tax=Spirillospora sp. NPDC047279 TaxID=3155478 RepID=UPI00340DB30F